MTGRGQFVVLSQRAVWIGDDYSASGAQARPMAVLLDRLSMLEFADICLQQPVDAKLQRITSKLIAGQCCSSTLGSLAVMAGMTERTAARLLPRRPP